MKRARSHNKGTPIIISLLAISAVAANVSKGQTVFSDTFSLTPGTALAGTSADIGGVWYDGNGNGGVISPENTFDTSGNGRLLFNSLTATLGAGEAITLSYDTLMQANNAGLNGGWAGVSLYSGYAGGSSGSEQMFLGEVTSYDWGKDGAAIGGQQYGSDNNIVNHLTFTYAYDTGAWTMTSDNSSLSGIGTPDLALNGLRIGNGGNADINLDNLTVTITQVPEPASLALFGLGGIGLALYRRRHS